MAEITAALAAWLSEQQGRPVEVRSMAIASTGARRMNALFDAVVDGQVLPMAITMIPTAAIQILDVAGEACVRTLAEQAGVPVPHVHHVCSDEGVLGGPFFISSAVEGETIPRRVLRLVRDTDVGHKVVQQLGSAFANLHSIDTAQAPADLVATPSPIRAAIEDLDRSADLLLDPSPTFAHCIRWLEHHVPAEPQRLGIVHSDIRVGNVIVGADGLRAILDWETARIGDPMEDLAWPCMRMWRFRNDEHTVGGLGDVATMRNAYVAAGGVWDEQRFDWWRIASTVRWGLGLAGQARAHLDGSFSSIVMAGSGRRVPELEYDALLLLRPR